MLRLPFQRTLLVLSISSALVACGGSSSSSSPTTGGGGGGGGDDTGITLSGSVFAQADDATAVATRRERVMEWIVRLNPVRAAYAAADTGAATNQALPNATVTLFKVFGQGGTEEQVDIGEVTTDSNGAFEISGIDAAPAGTGQATDFYYEVRITKGDLELRAPSAPGTDDTVNVTPESDLASRILSDVVVVPGEDSPPIPKADTIEALRELVIQNAADLQDSGAIAIPSALDAQADDTLLATANGLAAGGGNAEKVFKAASFEAEYLELTGDDSTTNADSAAYIKRVTREACSQAAGSYLPQTLADALGAFMNGSDNTVTLAEIISAYNDNFSGPDLAAGTQLSDFQTLLEGVATKTGASADTATELSKEELLALYANRGSLEGLTADTALTIDQAILLIQFLNYNNDQCEVNPQLDLYGFISDLIGNATLKNPSISNYEIYHNSGFGCNEGSGEGHFVANVEVNAAGKTVTGVTISSSDTSALGGDGTEALTLNGNSYGSNQNAICVALGSDVTYTITATFSDTTTATKTVTRNHPRIPEASSQVLVDGSFVNGSDQASGATVVTTTRPLYQWTSPDQMLTNIKNDAANVGITSSLNSSGATVKYTYEFAHVDTSVSPVGPAAQCESVQAGALYAVDSFIPTVDCDVSACATALSTTPDNIACRMNIQSYYVDENDNILGQAAGHFRFFCVDTDDDDSCG